MRDATYDPDSAARAIIAALSGSAVTLAELDEDLRCTAVYSPGALLAGREALGRTAVDLYGPQGEPLMDLARRAMASGDLQVAALSLVDGGLTRQIDVRIASVRADRGPIRLSLLAMERPEQADQAPARDPAGPRFLEQLVDTTPPIGTHHRDAEEELRRGRDLLRTTFECLSDGLLLIDRDGRVLAANQRVTSLLGLADQPLVGQQWGAIVATIPELAISCVDASLRDGQARNERLQLPARGERQRTLDLQVLPVQGDTDQLLIYISDMTERLQLEAQMIERERFVATGRLAATVAHEVNTPLQAIESCLHLAGRVEDPAERTRYLRLAREEIKRVGYTMRQLLDLYRPSGAPAPLDINGLIERVLLLTGNSLARRAIQIERDLSNDLPVIVGRADEITQVLLNLVFNAMQAMPQGGRLSLESARVLERAGGLSLAIRVRDSGVGIAPELRERIFEPFFTTRSDGTGLGLAICRRIIEGHGGVLRVESGPGAGSCFIIEIPAA